MLIVVLRWYKKWKREDVLPNEHILLKDAMTEIADHMTQTIHYTNSIVHSMRIY